MAATVALLVRCECMAGGKSLKLTAVLAQHSLHVLLQLGLAGVHGGVRRLEHQGLGGGVHEKDIFVVLLHGGARGLGAEVPDGHELLPLQAAAVDGPHIQHLDIHTVGLPRGDVLGGGAHLALDDHGGSVRLVLEGVKTRGVTSKGDPDDQHGEMHWIKPHAVSLCCAAVLLGGGASWKRRTAANGLRQSRQGRAADLLEVSMPSGSAAAFPIRLLASDGGTHQPRNRTRRTSACLKMWLLHSPSPTTLPLLSPLFLKGKTTLVN